MNTVANSFDTKGKSTRIAKRMNIPESRIFYSPDSPLLQNNFQGLGATIEGCAQNGETVSGVRRVTKKGASLTTKQQRKLSIEIFFQESG
jgi:hypothetical protein